MKGFHANSSRRLGKTVTEVAAITLAVTASAGSYAAELQTGEWSGTITPPEGVTMPTTFTVSEAGGELRISVLFMNMPVDLRDIELTDDGISFNWSPGPNVRCELDLQDDGSYSGGCVDQSGGMGHMSMVPPE